jgi:hypothetical protein
VRRSEAEAYAALGQNAQYAGHFDKY